MLVAFYRRLHITRHGPLLYENMTSSTKLEARSVSQRQQGKNEPSHGQRAQKFGVDQPCGLCGFPVTCMRADRQTNRQTDI